MRQGRPDALTAAGLDPVVLVCDPGSSSLRLLLAGPGDQVVASRHLEQPPGSPAAAAAVEAFLGEVVSRPVRAVGYRLVYGGPALTRPSLVDDEVLRDVRAVAGLAPLHLPPTLDLLDNLRRRLPDVPHVVCPDTAFHRGLPAVAATFALPAPWREKYHLRRFGFHGLSYAWALRRTGELLGRRPDELHLVMAHLGGGASVTAVRDGLSVDTSMSMTPLDGVPMCTRSGAIDPGVLLWLLEGDRLTLRELTDGLYHRSGLLGLSGLSDDTRVLVVAADSGDEAARLALDHYSHRLRREIAAASASLDRLDALVLTGEIGWDQPEIRTAVCAGLGILGVRPPIRDRLDADGPVSAPDASVPVLVIEPREDLELARETLAALDALDDSDDRSSP